MKYIYLILIFFGLQAGLAQEITLRKGVVIDTLSINDSIAETYSIYLPTTFTTQQRWPVIFVFDPNGRGNRAAQLFRQAAEAQGYIIAASNDIKENETLLNNVKIATRLMNTVFNYFPIDNKMVYTSGFAEGARVASVMPTVFPVVQGVLAIGDSWVNVDYINKNAKFSFLGMAGYKDAKYHTVMETARFLESAKLQSNFYPFDGGKEWPSAEVLNNAIGNLTLNAMAKGFRAKDSVLIESLYTEELETAESLRRGMQFFKAHELLSLMERKYAVHGKSSLIKEKLKDLGKERLYKNQRRDYSNAAAREADLMERYYYFLNEDVISANFENLGWWSQQIKELKDLQASNNIADAEMAFRLEGLLQDLAKSFFRELQEAKAAIDPLIFTAILQTIFEKENPEGYKNIISLSSQDGDYYTALLYLEDLLKTGYKDMDSLYEIPGTLDLKMSPEYNSLIKQYLGNSKYYNN
ncbi:hypothetical protein [Antarcticibacterium arcticum]|uniref:hypothetical protein n=1 Tax=Antarcticibacterium arcticum TaxID=2585771 RepID=UPI001F0DB908|nr:hypothetical protein [Antarcticibacterium arcticum]